MEIVRLEWEKEATLNVETQTYCKHKEHGKGRQMKPLTIIYWTRFLLGIVAGLICSLLSGSSSFSIFNGISIALLVYIITYYVYKNLFMTKVEKPSKILSTGVGAYFLSWIVMWALFYTIFVPRTPLT